MDQDKAVYVHQRSEVRDGLHESPAQDQEIQTLQAQAGIQFGGGASLSNLLVHQASDRTI
jgi:hypothetical protein